MLCQLWLKIGQNLHAELQNCRCELLHVLRCSSVLFTRNKGTSAHAQVMTQGHACCMCHDCSQVPLSATALTHHPVKLLLTLHNLLLARACALHDSSHYRLAAPRILCFRVAPTERKQSSRMRDTRPSSRAGAHVAAVRPIITQQTKCCTVSALNTSLTGSESCVAR